MLVFRHWFPLRILPGSMKGYWSFLWCILYICWFVCGEQMCYSDSTSLESVSSRGEILLCVSVPVVCVTAQVTNGTENVFYVELLCYHTFIALRQKQRWKKEHKIFNYPILKTECVNVWAHEMVNSYCIHLISYVKHIVFWKVLNSQGVKTKKRDCRSMQQNMWNITKEKMVMKYVRVCEC